MSNTTSNPVSVQSQNDAPSHPFTTSGTCTYGASTCDVQFQTVPAGKMFVIENLSVFIDVQAGSFIDAQLVIEPPGGGNAGNVRLTAPFSGTAHTHNIYDTTQLVRLYAPESSVLELLATASSDATTGTAQIFLSGYLVNTPS